MKFIFISYISRSGSSFMMERLSAHPEIIAIPEGEILLKRLLNKEMIVDQHEIIDMCARDKKLNLWCIDKSFFNNLDYNLPSQQFFLHFLQKYALMQNPKVTCIVFKAQELINHFQKLHEILYETNQILMVCLIRDPRAVFVSQKNAIYNGRQMENNPIILARKWKKFVNKTFELKLSLPELFILKYEDLLLDTNKIMRNLVHKINLSNAWLENGNYIQKIKMYHPYLHRDLQFEPDIKRITNWSEKITKNELAVIQKIAGSTIKKMGYKNVETGEKYYFFQQIIYQLFRLYRIIEFRYTKLRQYFDDFF